MEKCINEFGERCGYKQVSLIYGETQDQDIIDQESIKQFLIDADNYLLEISKTDVECPCPDNIEPGNLLEFISVNYRNPYVKTLYNMGFRPSLSCPSREGDKYKISIILPNGHTKNLVTDKSNKFAALRLWTELIIINDGKNVIEEVLKPEIVNPFEKLSMMFGGMIDENSVPDQKKMGDVVQNVTQNMTKMFENIGVEGATQNGQPPCCLQ